MDGCRTDAYRLSSASCTVSLTVLVVLSMLSLPCGASMTSGYVDIAWLALNFCEASRLPFLRRCPQQMSALLSGRSAHSALSFVAQFVVIWLITCQTEGLVRSQSVLRLYSASVKCSEDH